MLATIYITWTFFFNSLNTSPSNIQLHDRNILKVGFFVVFRIGMKYLSNVIYTKLEVQKLLPVKQIS